MTLEELSAGLEQLVERVSGSVVALQAGGPAISGLVVKPEHVLSIHHVLERNDEVKLVAAEGGFTAEVIGRDRLHDLALLRVPSLQAPALTAGAAASVGALNLIVARSMRGNLEVTQGVVAFNSGSLEMGRGLKLDQILRSSAPAFSGISGAPMLNAAGALIGVVNGSWQRGSSLALSGPKALEVARTLENGGGLQRGYLGVGVQPVRLEAGTGLLVNSVEADGPAASAGVLIGDVLLKLNGLELGSPRSLSFSLSQNVNQSVPLELRRGGAALTLQVTVAARAGRSR